MGIVVYYYCGQYTQTPAVANLKPLFKKISFAFVLPTTIIIGVIYAAVVVRYLFHRFTFNTRHYNNHTVIGWSVWVACCLGTWIFGWISESHLADGLLASGPGNADTPPLQLVRPFRSSLSFSASCLLFS